MQKITLSVGFRWVLTIKGVGDESLQPWLAAIHAEHALMLPGATDAFQAHRKAGPYPRRHIQRIPWPFGNSNSQLPFINQGSNTKSSQSFEALN